METRINYRRPIIYGISASFILLSLFFIIVSLTESFDHALSEFFDYYLFLIPLAAGFGIQIGLGSYINAALRVRNAANSAAVTNGGISTGSMIACCAHHLTDVIPLFGLSLIATFLASYQAFFMSIGLFANIIGILFMLDIAKNHELYAGGSLLFVKNYDFKSLQKAVFIIGSVASLFIFFLTATSYPAERVSSDLDTQVRRLGDMTFEATPALAGNEMQISLKIDTHSTDLDFDPAQISWIVDSRKKTLPATSWEGSPPGGHHRTGTLRFPNPTGDFNLYLRLPEGTISFRWGE